MRVESVSQAKGKRHALNQAMPSSGSRRSAAYARLLANRGHYVDLRDLFPAAGGAAVVSALRDTYGCDILAKRGRGNVGYMLAGEWFGKDYRDYVNEAIDAAVIERDSAKPKDSQ